jgi:tRNA(Ile)-lysidine synthase
VPIRVLRVDAAAGRGESPEAAARAARYRALAPLLAPGDLLLTAHHQDDQAETLLLALMRGSGLKGLAGMPAVTHLAAGRLVRPLLGFRRAELRDYAQSVGLDWIEDPGNQDQGLDRNLLRHRVLPLLVERWPACTTTIARSAGHCAEGQGVIDRIAERELEGLGGTRAGTLSVSRLRVLDPPLCRVVLRHWISQRGFGPPDVRHLQRITTEVLSARPDAGPLVAWAGCEVRRYRDDLYAMDPLPPALGPDAIPWRTQGLVLPSGLGHLVLLDTSGREVDPARVSSMGLEVRFRVPGLWFRPEGKPHRRPLKKLFQEAGVPPWLRILVPLVFREGDLVAVAGLCGCDSLLGNGVPTLRLRWTDRLAALGEIGR